MRIAVIGKKYPFCGIVTYCREQVRALKERGHAVAFYYMHESDAAAPENEAALPVWFETHMWVLPAPTARQRLERRLRLFQPDVVHASFALGPLDWALPEVCAGLGIPLVVTFHVALDHRPSFPNRVSSLVYRMYASTLARCQCVIVFSRAQHDRLVRFGVPARLVTILPNGVDVARYSPGPSHFRSAIGASRLLTFMGRLDPEKNVGKLLEVFGRLPPGDNVHLALIGEGVLGPALRARFGDLPRVHWLGFVAEEATRIDVLRGSDLFVLPSSIEGLSLALLEGMACGAVPVATDVGADGEVVNGVGRLIDPTRLRAQLGPAIADLLADPREMARLGALARRRVELFYVAARNIMALEAIYEAVRRAPGAFPGINSAADRSW